MSRFVFAASLSTLLLSALCGQRPEPAPKEKNPQEQVQLADIQAFGQWLQEYGTGAFRLMKDGRTDEAALAKVEAMMQKVAQWNTLAAAKQLFVAASIDPSPPGAHTSDELIDFHRELQPWLVQGLAVKHLAAMNGPGISEWLIGLLSGKGLRAAAKNLDQRNAAAALRVLGGQDSLEAQVELTRACLSMPVELRVQAVAALAQKARLEIVPTLLDLLRDAEPNVRIAAASALGAALAPYVDETLAKKPTDEVLKTRDQVIAKLQDLLVRDKIWQVRSAAAFSLAGMKCKPVVPALIEGLKVELQRKKDPWAMDMRLHRLLEGLTGQTVLRGSIALWEQFWQKEGPTFTVRPKQPPGKAPLQANRYQKFFDLEIESDRVLFVLDFSGSMDEPITLKGDTTVVKAGTPTTKAELVKAELKKIVMSFPDNALVNFIVFSDDVRLWREDRGRPALVKLDDAARDDLLGTFLDSLHPRGSTNLYGALSKALDFAGRGLYDKYYEAGFDTLYVITDGAPSSGEIIDKDEIRRRVRAANTLRKLTIHCVTFGDQNDTDFLRPLAEENGGRHIHIE